MGNEEPNHRKDIMEQIRKTKIVCTLGPATDREDILERLVRAGMNVARFNFSHGTHEEQLRRLKMLQSVRERLQTPVAALMDTKGPEIRLKQFDGGKAQLSVGQTFTLTTREVTGDSSRVSITYQGLPKDVSVGTHILIDDGLIEMEVIRVTDTDIECRVKNGGKVSDRKGVNVPNVDLSMPYIGDDDYRDLVFAVQQDYDYVAASFVRSAADVEEVRGILRENGGEDIKIIAKIENHQGIRNVDEIIRVSDGVMVARGDMGVEIPLEDVPVIQKVIIKKVYTAGKTVITATQMLDSMMTHPRPTRAEATDVANAIYDGTSAIMLSGETAAGDYPVEAVETMAKIASRTEADINYLSRLNAREPDGEPSITDAISHSACLMAGDLHATAIVTVSKSGRTAHMISKYRPACPIVGGCLTPKVYRQLNLCWGVTPLLIDEKQNAEELFDHALARAREEKFVLEGDTVVLTAGVPVGMEGTTNLIKAQIV